MDDATITLLVLAAAVALFVWNRLPVAVVALGAALSLYAADVVSLEESVAGFGDPTVLFIASLFVISEALDASGVTTWAGQRLVEAARGDPTRLVVLVLTGSPVNVLVAEAAAGSGAGRFGFFEFALVGVPLVVGTIGLVLVFGDRLLPVRRARSLPPDLSRLAETLADQYALGGHGPRPREVPGELFTRQAGVAEVVVPPRSPLIGQVVFPGMVTDSGDLVVLSVQRAGEQPQAPEVTVAAGDTLLVEGSWRALDQRLEPEEVLVVDPPDVVRRQVVALGPGARRTLAVTGVFVVVLAAGLVPPAVAGVLAAMALVLLGALDTEQAYRAVSWTTVILIAGLIPVSVAIQTTGAADDVAGILVDVVGASSPTLLLAGLFVIAAVFSVAVSNTATALILIPIALSAAAELDVATAPVLMSVAVACSASFMTPISTPGNMIVMGPGGYRFGDYWRVGLPFLLLFFVVAVLLVPVVWSF